MTIEYAALAIGAFLVILIWGKLRFVDARLRKLQKKLEEFDILYNRLFMTVMNANPKVAEYPRPNPQNAAAKSDGGAAVRKSDAEAIALVPPSGPAEDEQHTSGPGVVQ
jgi:hypothetical protein